MVWRKVLSASIVEIGGRLAYLWHGLAVKTHHNSTHWLTIVLNVEEDLVCDLWSLGCGRSLAHEEKGGSKEDHQGDDDSLKVRHAEEHQAVA